VDRRTFLAGLTAGGLIACAEREQTPSTVARARAVTVFFGTYTAGNSPSKGIYTGRLDLDTGSLTSVVLAAPSTDPSYLALHPDGRFLYAVNEVSDFDGKASGGVEAFAIGPSGTELRRLNQIASGGGAPCHLAVDRQARFVVVANYGGGSVASFPIQADGSLGPRAGFVQHEGRGPNQQRQEAAHAHLAAFDPAARRLFVCDLGIDRVCVYGLGPTGALVPNVPPSVSLRPGAGPRHLAFAPNGHFVYVNNELDSTVTVLTHDPATGIMTPVDTVTTLPAGFVGTNSTAHVQITPDGEFLYVSNRGHDSLAIFRIDERTGRLTVTGHASTGGKTPRDFCIDPTGAFLLAANQASDNVVVLRIDRQSGALAPVNQPIPVPRPVCVVFAARG
jgi:6-phosphogluconolactonase